MSVQNCGIIMPRQKDIIDVDGEEYLAECIRPLAHINPHVVKTPDGKYYAWEWDFDCDCCGPEEDDRCYVCWEINKEEM